MGTENRLSKLRDGMAGRTVTDSFVEIESLNLATTCRTDRRRLRNPSLGRISLHVLRDVLDYSYFNYKVRGLRSISLITWGLKEVTLS